MGFSIAFDSGNKSNQSFVDVTICFSLDCQGYNLHLLALPVHECHTGLNMYNLIKKCLDALYCGWKDKLIGISQDEASNMTASEYQKKFISELTSFSSLKQVLHSNILTQNNSLY